MEKASLHKKERLKSRKEIDFLFNEGSSFPLNPFRVYYTIKNQESKVPEISLQAGVGVSSRNFKKAVDRNRIKRVSREAYRLQKLSLQKKLLAANKKMRVFFIYTARELPEFAIVKERIATILNRLEHLVNEHSTPAA